MRQGQQNRRRGRGNSNNNNNATGNANRKPQNPLSRTYESSGPDVKIRGTASQIAEKYIALARDASSSGDTVMSENYLQHAEHYNRIIMAAQAHASASGSHHHGESVQHMNGANRPAHDGNGAHREQPQPQYHYNSHQPQQRAQAAMASQQASGHSESDDAGMRPERVPPQPRAAGHSAESPSAGQEPPKEQSADGASAEQAKPRRRRRYPGNGAARAAETGEQVEAKVIDPVDTSRSPDEAVA
jgi:hypothetical protein